MKTAAKIAAILIAAALILTLAACSGPKEHSPANSDSDVTAPPDSSLKLIDVTGIHYREALSRLEDADVYVRIENVRDGETTVDFVAKTDPAPGSTYNTADTVTIFVSVGDATETVVVPDYVGRPIQDVADTISGDGLQLGFVTHDASSDAESGHIISQSIEPGTEAYRNSVITFEVAGIAS